MRPVFTAEEMRRVDRRAVDTLGIPGATLMEHAGRGAAQVILELLPTLGAPRRGARVALVCGKGGNGGDGFVAARRLRQAGVRVTVLVCAPSDEIVGDAGSKLAELRRAGVRPAVVGDAAQLARPLAEAHVVVDALLGTGARGAPTGLVAEAIERINASGRPVVALDVPSGLPADGGPPPGPAIHAAVTVTFAGLKRGLVTPPGRALAGTVRVVGIGVPEAEVARGATVFLTDAADVAALFPPRAADAHKGSYGHLLVLAGSEGKTGAAALAATAALRSGAGLVTVATAASQQPIVAGLVLEAMTAALPETTARSLSLEALASARALAEARDAVALGPGLGLDAATQELARRLVRETPRPLVVDADALTAVAADPAVLRAAPAARVLTPHPGEMARLLKSTVAEVQRDRIACARDVARAYGVVVVLKGAASVVAAPDGRVWLNPTGNPGLASGGTGDVLTGIAGAFLARGFDPVEAARAAVYLHGRAGDLAAASVGEEALIARDVIAALPAAFLELRRPAAPPAS